MSNTPMEITKKSAITFLHEYILGDSESRTYLETYEETLIVFEDGYIFCKGSLFYRTMEETEPDEKKFIDYIITEHGLDNLIFLISRTLNINLMYVKDNIKPDEYDIDELFNFGYSLTNVDLWEKVMEVGHYDT